MGDNGYNRIMDSGFNEDDGYVGQWGVMGHNGNNGIMG